VPSSIAHLSDDGGIAWQCLLCERGRGKGPICGLGPFSIQVPVPRFCRDKLRHGEVAWVERR
jgi:hypothetical protein